jgi:hypothetical protein
VRPVNYPRRAQLRYTVKSRAAYAGGVLALAGAPVAVASSLPASIGLLALAPGLFAAGKVYGRRADRYRVGADSERVVADRLRTLEQRGWTVRHSVDWPHHGDIDHVVQAPGGPAFAIETKTGRYHPELLGRARAAAAYVAPRGLQCIPVICLARRRGVSFAEQGVHVISADLVAARLSELAGVR